MSKSLSLTSVAALQAYVQTFASDLISKAYYDAETIQSGVTIMEGIKGKHALTQLTVADLARRYASAFNVIDNTHVFTPREIEVVKAKVDLGFIPEEFEASYLGQFRKKGQSDSDLPFEGYLMMKTFEKLREEIEIAIWQADKAAVPASTDKLIALFDGWMTIVDDNIGDLAPYVSGNLTASNAFTAIENTFATIDSKYQKSGVDVIMSAKTMNLAIQQYRASYGYGQRLDGSPGFDLAGNITYKVLPGFPDNRILVTPMENLVYAIDAPEDSAAFNFQQSHRQMDFWTQFNIGVEFAIFDPDLVGVSVVTAP